MPRVIFILVWLLCHASSALAQQLLCERQLIVTAPAVVQAATLVSWQRDSLRLVSDYYPANATMPIAARVQRLDLTRCDTLPAGRTVVQSSSTQIFLSVATTNRWNQLLVAKQLVRPLAASGNRDSTRIILNLFNRDGSTQWRRVVPPQSTGGGVSGLIEAPGGGFYLFGDQPKPNGQSGSESFVLRLDSLGQVQWQRTYGQRFSFEPSNPVYTRTGTLLLAVQYPVSVPVLTEATGVMELNQQGDSLTTRRVLIDPQQYTQLPPYYVPNSLLPLRDGGFALVGIVDSANTNQARPFLARLDRNLNLVWSYIHRQRLATAFVQPQELVDGSLVVVASNRQSGRGYPFWLFRFSATGTLQQTYPFVSQVLSANTSAGRYGFFGTAKGLQPLSDSSFVVVAGGSDTNSSRIYLAHLRVPGLPRVIDSHYLPAAQPLAARPAQTSTATLELFPNPAREAVYLAYRLPPGSNAASLDLRDALGRLVLRQALTASRAELRLAVAHLPAGLYTATLCAQGRVPTRRPLLIAP